MQPLAPNSLILTFPEYGNKENLSFEIKLRKCSPWGQVQKEPPPPQISPCAPDDTTPPGFTCTHQPGLCPGAMPACRNKTRGGAVKKRGVRISNHIQKGMPAPTLFRYFTVKDKEETDENTCCPSMSPPPDCSSVC